jgi:hypothetical protein
MHGIRATALRWISDEPQPGWIEVEFIDADGRRWLVHDKPPMFVEPPGDGFLPTSSYPAPTLIPCDLVSREESPDGRELVTVILRHTDTTTGEVRFQVAASELVTARWTDCLEGRFRHGSTW